MFRRCLLILCLMLSLGVIALGQSYTPKPGETVMQLNLATKGTVHIKLHTKEAPRTTSQIIRLVQSGFYDGQRFFRVEKTPKPFLVQTGDPASRDQNNLDLPSMGSGGSGVKIPYEETGFANETGAVGLSTLPNNRDSGDSQFYILLGNFPFLDGNYTVFGKVVAGFENVRKIERGDVIQSARIVKG